MQCLALAGVSRSQPNSESPPPGIASLQALDSDGDDLLSRAEIEALITRHRVDAHFVTMASMDEDGSLTLSWAEASWAPPGSKPSVSRAQFDAIDRNGDGEHSLSEFGVALDGSMAAALDGLFAANDLNPKDGKIDAERCSLGGLSLHLL